MQTGHKEQAYTLLKGLAANYPNDSHLLLWAAYSASDLTEARRLLDTARKVDPANSQLGAAQKWLAEQEKNRLGKRFRQDIQAKFVPALPPQLSSGASNLGSNGSARVSPPLAVSPTNQGWSNAKQTAVPAPAVTTAKAATNPQNLPGANPMPAQPITKPADPKKSSPATTPPIQKKPKDSFWRKAGLILLILVIAAGGLLAIPSVREVIFDNGPLNIAEQNYVNEVNQLNDLTTTRLNKAYDCLLLRNPALCPVDEGYRSIYKELGEVKDKFTALKNPSSRFNAVHTMLTSAYTNLGVTSGYALESINQKRLNANLTEMLARLDSNRKLLEQSKADLKSLAQTYNKK